jgi:hypothetical protein
MRVTDAVSRVRTAIKAIWIIDTHRRVLTPINTIGIGHRFWIILVRIEAAEILAILTDQNWRACS